MSNRKEVLELEKVVKMFRYKNYFNRDQIITLGKTIIALSQEKPKENNDNEILLNRIKELEKKVDSLQQEKYLKPPSTVINQYIQNANITQGPPKRMNVNMNINYGMNETEYNERKGGDFKSVIEDLKKNERFLKQKQVCEFDVNEMKEVQPNI